MNRRIRIVCAALVAASLLHSCRIETDPAQRAAMRAADTTATVSRPMPDADSLMTLLLTLQNAVYRNPLDLQARRTLITAAFDSAGGNIYSVGKGVANPSMAAGTAAAGQPSAAQSDARRWVLYERAWIAGDARDVGSEISGEISYSSVLLESPDSDTLYVLVQVPYGSVSVE